MWNLIKEDRKTESNVLRPKPLHILPALPSTPKPRLQQVWNVNIHVMARIDEL